MIEQQIKKEDLAPLKWWHTQVNNSEELEMIKYCFEHEYFTLGPITQKLEENLENILKVPHVVATNSGTSALEIALLASGIEKDDEVIVPDLTWIATGQAIKILGAEPVLVDCLYDTPLIDMSEVKKKITSKTKAIIPVHLNGRSCNMDELLEIREKHGISIIEDACKAFTSKTPRGYLGTIGDAGCFSTGIIGLFSVGGYGGFIATRNNELYEKIILTRDHGVHRGRKEKLDIMGGNFKISDILSGIGLVQLSRLKEKREHVNRIYGEYVKGLADLDYLKVIPVSAPDEISLMQDVRSKYKEQIIDYLYENNVGTSRFHIPMHRARYFGNYADSDFPNSTMFSNEGFVLPSGPSQPLENVYRCIELLHKFKPMKEN